MACSCLRSCRLVSRGAKSSSSSCHLVDLKSRLKIPEDGRGRTAVSIRLQGNTTSRTSFHTGLQSESRPSSRTSRSRSYVVESQALVASNFDHCRCRLSGSLRCHCILSAKHQVRLGLWIGYQVGYTREESICTSIDCSLFYECLFGRMLLTLSNCSLVG